MLGLFCEEAEWLIPDNITLPRLAGIPHVRECFQEVLMAIVPIAFFVVFLPIILYALHASTNGSVRSTSPRTFRIIFCFFAQQILGLIVILRLGLFGDGAVAGSHRITYLSLQNTAMWAVSLAMFAIRNRGLLYSSVMFNFWLLLTLCSVPNVYFRLALLTNINETSAGVLESVLFVVYFVLVVLTFLLCCFVDIPAYRPPKANICPEKQTSFLNQLTFVWFESLIRLGFRRPLTMDDLWELPEEDRSRSLFEKFTAIWAPYLEKHRQRQDQQKSSSGKTEKIKLLAKNDQSESETLITKENGPNDLLVAVAKNGTASSGDTKKKATATDTPADQPSFLWPLVCMFKWLLLGGALYKLIFDMLQFAAPHLLKYFIDFVQNPERPMWVGIGLALAMFGTTLFQSLLIQQYFHYMCNVGMHIRAVLTSAVYKKALLLSSTARRGRTIGEIVNLMAIDIQRFQDITITIMLVWSSPLQIILATYFLWRLLGVSIFAGLLLLLALISLNLRFSKLMQRYQMEQMRHKDERMKVLSEMLNGIKVLKLYAWESSIQKTILDIRRRERNVLRKLALINSILTLMWSSAPFLVAVLTFGIYVSLDIERNVLTPQITFVGLALFNVLRFPLTIFGMVVNQLNQCIVGYNRLKRFLADEEVDLTATVRLLNSELPTLAAANDKGDEGRGVVIQIRDATHSWDRDGDSILHNISLDIKRGQLVAVVGRIGSGKSSLLSAILGDMCRREGLVATDGRIAYMQQQAWIQNLSLMDNVLFGRAMNAGFYNRVLDACALRSDLAILPAGDQTEIGEKSINLSGGQKQRVSMARAVYADADIYLLDDPLAAVDAHVGKQIFENVIGSKTGLLRDKTRIFVTHGLHFLKHCDQIVVLKDGQVSERGTFKELANNNGAFSEILEDFLLDEAKKTQFSSFDDGATANTEGGVEFDDVMADLEQVAPERKRKIIRQLSTTSSQQIKVEDGRPPCASRTSQPPLPSFTGGQAAGSAVDNPKENLTPSTTNTKATAALIENEAMQMGHVKFCVYLSYLRAIGLAVCAIFIVVFMLSALLGVASNLWLTDWSDHAIQIQSQSNNSAETHQRLLIYTSLGIGQAMFVAVASALISMGMVSAGILLHERMLKNILRAPMAFFDVTPIGRILNRFTKDIDFVDSRLPATLINCINTVLQSAATLAVPLIVTPAASVPIVFVLGVYVLVTRYYIRTSRQLKRLESTVRSPIFAHFQESVQGASSIRAFGATQRFLAESQRRVDESLKANYHSLVANRWLAVRLELVGNFVVLCSTLFAALFRDNITAGLAGLSVTYALSITQTLNWAVRMSSELEANIVAVERIEEYSVIPSEAAEETPAALHLDEKWPTSGEIQLNDLELCYRPDLEPVLKGISAHIKSREKIGIIGRTGAGKSSLTLALFRLVEPSNGQILIDDLDISSIGLRDLRSRLTIVPQDPVLFSGTLRKNLDPFEKHSDEEIEKAVRLTHLTNFVAGLTNGLKHTISEGGDNISTRYLSVGERQLICLARVVLRQSRIIVLDEAAASVDIETEQLIQKTIIEQFSECTVLTIAHRLQSVMGSDRIMVFEQGRLVEFDAPAVLLARADSVFRSLAVDAGVTTGV